MRHGTEEQKQKYLPKLCSGEWIGCFGLTEPCAGSDVAGLKTTAVGDGDSWVLNGSKMFITNAPIADLFIIFAITDKSKNPNKKMSAFIIEKGREGMTIGPKLKKMGMRASPTSEVFLNNCRIPLSSLMGEEGCGFLYALASIENERALSAAMSVGIGRRALDESIRYAKERNQFGQPIANFQQVQYMIAEMAANIHAGRCMMYDIIERKNRGENISYYASMVKLFCAQMLTKVTLDALQIHGGYGYMREFPVERLTRDAKLLELGGGTNEIQRIVIAKHLLQSTGVC
jgi:alkylation response protein AidB-like acyl-CoA dehydrogenase